MPLTYREVFQIGLLLLCVPVQYFLSSSSQSDADKTQALVRLLHEVKDLKETWFSLKTYRDLWHNLAAWFAQVLLTERLPNTMYAMIREDETPAYEVLRYRQEKGYFTMSPVERNYRPRHLLYRVGQVVRHRMEGYVGVIIGWDLKAKASEQWLSREYGDRQALRHFPHYAVLVDEQDPILLSTMTPEASYVVQQDLELVTNVEVQHPFLNNFFSAYDGAQYISKSWLRKLYPKD